MTSPSNKYRGFYYSAREKSDDIYYALHVYTRSFEDAKIAGDILARPPFATPIKVVDADEA